MSGICLPLTRRCTHTPSKGKHAANTYIPYNLKIHRKLNRSLLLLFYSLRKKRLLREYSGGEIGILFHFGFDKGWKVCKEVFFFQYKSFFHLLT